MFLATLRKLQCTHFPGKNECRPIIEWSGYTAGSKRTNIDKLPSILTVFTTFGAQFLSSDSRTIEVGSIESVRLLSRDELRRVDSEATERFGIPSIVLMENASRGLAAETLRLFRDSSIHKKPNVLIVCGAGNNGGDGYAASRHLHNAGCNVTLLPLNEPRPESDAAINAQICHNMNLSTTMVDQFAFIARKADIVIDAIFGTGLDRDVTGQAAHVIAVLNELEKPVVAADVPSGLDCETGRVLGEAVRATVTVKFVALTQGMLTAEAQDCVGRIVIAGIGAPIELVREMGRPIDDSMLKHLAHPLRMAG